MTGQQEILVVVDDGDRLVDAIEQWRRSAAVTQLLPPRLALLLWRGEAADGEAADGRPEHVPGTRWFSGDVPPDVLGTLTPAERLFVAAWRERQAPKVRPGDGLSWDAPGLRPPDPPRPPAHDSGR